MTTVDINNTLEAQDLDGHPWYREPWPWVLIAIPFLTIVACGFTFYLAVSNPDYIVVDDEQYKALVEDLKPSPRLGSGQSSDNRSPDPDDGRH